MSGPSSVLQAPITQASGPPAELIEIVHAGYPAKRVVDLALGVAMVVLTSPAWLLIALAIKLEDGGPVFYVQTRYGRGARPIRIRKFRTMVADADERYGLRQARNGDERVTRVGRLLRSSGLDELPQLLSILRGDMSFVGPRPMAIGEIAEDRRGRRILYEQTSGFHQRLLVRPGLTSLATVHLPKDAHPGRKFRLDMVYIQRQSLMLDLGLIAMSFWISLSCRWEKQAAKA